MKENNVEMMLGFNKEEKVEDLKIEPKLHVVTTYWKCVLLVKICCAFGLKIPQ
jgi:hypothetical protein